MSILYEGDPFRRAPSKWASVAEELKHCAATGFIAVAALLLCLFTFALAGAYPHSSLHIVRAIGGVFLAFMALGNGVLSVAGGFRAIRAWREMALPRAQ